MASYKLATTTYGNISQTAGVAGLIFIGLPFIKESFGEAAAQQLEETTNLMDRLNYLREKYSKLGLWTQEDVNEYYVIVHLISGHGGSLGVGKTYSDVITEAKNRIKALEQKLQLLEGK